MFSTSVALTLFVVLISAQILLSAWLLRIGARWAKAGSPSYKRAAFVMLLITVFGNLVSVVSLWRSHAFHQSDGVNLAIMLVQLVVFLVVSWKLVQWMLHTTFGKAVLAWLPTLLATGAMWLTLWAVVVPYCFEAFYVPTNAMAPTILGRHYRSTCPTCNAVRFVSASSPEPYVLPDEPGICARCLRTSVTPLQDTTAFPGERIAVGKFLRPRRWDVIVFKYPADPSVNYVMRLVGLPGERIAIKSGDLWINGKQPQRPKDLGGLVYEADVDQQNRQWGPVTLADGEYFVLGDFSRKSSDSRYWVEGAPGHPPYAVPESNILGVVTHIYWPPSRWRILR